MVASFRIAQKVYYTTHWAKSHYPPGNLHASHLYNVLFTGHNHLLTTGTEDSALYLLPECHRGARWLWPGNRTCLEEASMVVTWWIVAFLHIDYQNICCITNTLRLLRYIAITFERQWVKHAHKKIEMKFTMRPMDQPTFMYWGTDTSKTTLL